MTVETERSMKKKEFRGTWFANKKHYGTDADANASTRRPNQFLRTPLIPFFTADTYMMIAHTHDCTVISVIISYYAPPREK